VRERRRILSLFFPTLPTDRLRRTHRDAPPPDLPFACVEKQRGAMRLTAVDGAALAMGLTPGMMLADARARVPEVATAEHDTEADIALIERLADLCDRYTPMVMPDLPDGLTLDITGAEHLFAGEQALAEDAVRRIAALGIATRYALAGTPEAAWSLARYQSLPAPTEQAAIRRLPIAALRLEDEALVALRRAGLSSIGDLADRPSAPISARFGEEASECLRRMLGLSDSRIVPRRPPPELHFARRFAEPIARTDDVMASVRALVDEAVEALARRGAGGRCFALRCFRSDGAVRDLSIETALPQRDGKAVMRLMRERIDTLADPLDPGFGFDLIRMAVPRAEPLGVDQLALDGGDARNQSDNALAVLVDRLSVREGADRIRRFVPQDTHIPEQGVLALPAVDAGPCRNWPAAPPGEPPERPIHLLDPPQPVQVIAEVPDGPPQRFRWGRRLHEVVRFEGPERIAAEWWRREGGHDANPGLTRDYYRIEDRRGRRYWLFRHGLYGSERATPGWYIHGLFA
jgi:protein ImuB